MSAMHWEARRRQSVLDRRAATKAKQSLTEDKQKQGITEEGPRKTNWIPSVSAVRTEPLVIDKRIICQCQHGKEQFSAKIDNRYTANCQKQGDILINIGCIVCSVHTVFPAVVMWMTSLFQGPC